MKSLVLLIQIGVACAGCSGAVGQDDEPRTPAQGPEGPAGGAGGPGGRGGDSQEVAAGPAPLRRLSNTEYVNTVRDLLGASDQTIANLRLVDDVQKTGFDHDVAVQSLSADHVRSYADAAKKLSDDVFSIPQKRRALLTCDAPVTSPCVKSFVENFGLRALRRPLAAEEVDAYMAVYQSEANPDAGARLVLRTMLQSPTFLFRPEFGEATGQQNQRALTSYELATRLSYLVLQTTPSANLLAMAGANKLSSADDLTAAARQMMEDPRAKTTLRNFLRQAFGTRSIDGVSRDAKIFPMWSEGLRRAMSEELIKVGEELIWSQSGDFRSLVDAPFTFVDDQLADIYGVERPGAGQWAKVQWDASTPRAGLVTMPIVMAVTGKNDGMSAIWRGMFVRTHLLCEDLPPPPADVPALELVDTTLPERERLAQHRSNPACASCHALIDPIGFGLARYDAVGTYSVKDAQGRAIADDGVVNGIDDGEFRGAVGLAQLLRRQPQYSQCLTTKLLSFFAGRTLKEVDEPLVSKLHAVLNQRGSVQDVLLGYVDSDAFKLVQR